MTTTALPAGWSAGPVRLGSGFHHLGGSERVRDVQRLLWSRGFRPGPVDGLFGPQTEAAVKWFQIKHGLRADGIVGPGTLALLHERTGARPVASPESAAKPVHGAQPVVRGSSPQPRSAAQRGDGGQKQAGERGRGSALRGAVPVVLLLLAAPLAFLLLRRRGTSPKRRRPAVDREATVEPAPPAGPAAPSSQQPAAIGYVRSSRDRAELARHSGAIRQACSSRGWKLAELVRDDQASANGTSERPGLSGVMERLSTPGERRFVVAKLAHLSRSANELTSLFEWFAEHDVQVIAADAGIDTTTPDGAQAAQVLLAKVARRQANGNGHSNGHSGHANGNGHVNGNGHANGNGHPHAGGNGNGKVPVGAASNGKGDHG